jgi:hypothetical protein
MAGRIYAAVGKGEAAVARIFISYAQRDRGIVKRLADALQSAGLSVWLDESSILPGSELPDAILQEVRSADAVLVVVTEASLASAWVQRETEWAAARAHENGILLVPVFVDKLPEVRLPYELATRRGVRLDSSSRQSFLEAADQIKLALDARRSSVSERPVQDRKDGRLSSSELRDIAAVVIDVFAAAGRTLHTTDEPERLAPEPVWVSAEVAPRARELERFARWLTPGRVGYFVHLGELRRDAEIALDQMRVSGKTIITVSVRALRAALADGRVGFFLTELERDYGTKDNLFDTKNALIDERFLFGRDITLNTIGSSINRDEHVLITGLRKVGKTSLLNVLRQHLVDQPVCMVDLQRFDRHSEEWPLPLFQLMLAAFDRWGQAERSVWPFMSASPTTTTDLETELRRRLDYLGPAGAGMRMVVILDEIERVFPVRGEPEAARRWIRASGALRSLSQGEHRYVVVIGADLRPIANRENDLGAAGTNPFFNLFQEMPVTLLDQHALADMVESLARAMGVDSVTTNFIDRLFELTGGHPSLARTISAEAYRQRQKLDRLTEPDLDAGLSYLEDSGAIAFFLRNNLWQLMTPAEREVVAYLARGQSPSRPSAVHGSRGRGLIREDALATLRSQGLVKGDKVRIGLFRQWVSDHAEDD